ncbi:MAG: radical SAM protein [Acidimicrobiia bacterium]|nr:radical SAM protein [Acidimicrobiia bacterium]
MNYPVQVAPTEFDLPRLQRALAGRARHFRRLRVTGATSGLQALSLEVTRRCVAHCVMCNIWKTPHTLRELSVDQWLSMLRSPAAADLRELDVTGGEPFLRDDLDDLLLGAANPARSGLERLHSIAITTNGFLTKRVLRTIGGVAGPLEDAGVGLVFACAMDGIGEIHNRIRGYPGGWDRLHTTIEGLCALRERHPGMVLGLKMTVHHYNVGQVHAVAAYAADHGMFTIISPFIVTPARYGNLDLEADLAFTPEDIDALRDFYGGPTFRWSYYARELEEYFRTGQMNKVCTAGFNYAFIRSTGDLYPCPLLEMPLGNVLEQPLERLLASPAARRFRRKVGRYPSCQTCTEPGLERYALPFEGRRYLELSRRLDAGEFRQLHEHLGLDKYLD